MGVISCGESTIQKISVSLFYHALRQLPIPQTASADIKWQGSGAEASGSGSSEGAASLPPQREGLTAVCCYGNRQALAESVASLPRFHF
jgi:hypothetical protein